MQGKNERLISESELGRYTVEVPGAGRRSMQEVHDVYTFYLSDWSRRDMIEAMDYLTEAELDAIVERVILWKDGEPLVSAEDPYYTANAPYMSVETLPTPQEIEYKKWNIQYTGFIFVGGPTVEPKFRRPWSDLERETHAVIKSPPLTIQPHGSGSKHHSLDVLVPQEF